MKSKQELRSEMKSKLTLLSDEELTDLSLKLSAQLKKFLNDHDVIQRKLIVGVFAPIQQEPHWFLGVDEKIQTAYPAYAEIKMAFKLARMSELEKSKDFGVVILGPSKDAPIVTPDIVLVPGLAFSTDGKRLGRGKGFYDRYFEKSSVVKVGVAFEMQITKDVPVDEFDVVMDFVVTDKCIYKK